MKIVENESLKFPSCSEDHCSGELNFYKWLNQIKNPKMVFSIGAQKDFDFCKAFSNSEIHLFDPNKRAFRELINNDYLYNRPNTFLNFYGLGNKEDYYTYYFNGESVYNHDGKFETDKIFISTLKRYFESHQISHVDFMKIDVEGFEYEVIKGAEELIEFVDIIQFEYGERYPLAGKTLKMMYDLFPDRYIYHLEEDKLNLAKYPGEYYRYSNYVASKQKL